MQFFRFRNYCILCRSLNGNDWLPFGWSMKTLVSEHETRGQIPQEKTMLRSWFLKGSQVLLTFGRGPSFSFVCTNCLTGRAQNPLPKSKRSCLSCLLEGTYAFPQFSSKSRLVGCLPLESGRIMLPQTLLISCHVQKVTRYGRGSQRILQDRVSQNSLSNAQAAVITLNKSLATALRIPNNGKPAGLMDWSLKLCHSLFRAECLACPCLPYLPIRVNWFMISVSDQCT